MKEARAGLTGGQKAASLRANAGMTGMAALLFGSGLSALVYQTAWQKSFRLIFGASSSASAAVLAMFMAGLGLGGLIIGRRAEQSRRPLQLYGQLELGIALLAGLSPLLLLLVEKLYLSTGGILSLGSAGAAAVRLFLASVVMLPATFLMGGTLPAAARAVLRDQDLARKNLARLYALNTTGAVVGALVGPLLLFPLLGTRWTLWCAVLLNALVGVTAQSWGRRQAELPEPFDLSSAPDAAAASPAGARDDARLKATTSADGGALGVAEATQARPLARAFVYLTAALVGLSFLFLELVWFRLLAPLLGGSTITFGLILAVALSGIGLGGQLYSLRPMRRPATLSLLAATLGLEAWLLLLPFAWGDGLAQLAAHLRAMSNLGSAHLVIGWLVVCALVIFPAALVSGYQFPALFALLGRGRKGAAREVGTAYAFNTAGTLLGSLLGGFLILPWLGAVMSWRVSGLLLVALAILALVVAGWRAIGRPASAVAMVSCVAAVLCASFPGPGAVWRHAPVGAGRWHISGLSPNDLRLKSQGRGAWVDWEADGVETAIGIHVAHGIAFLVNGKSDGSLLGDRGTQVMLGLLPGVLHPKPERAFVVGLGTGTTAGVLGTLPDVSEVVVAELEPAVMKVARMSASGNGDVLRNPKVTVQTGDARELLLTQNETYDVIVSEPSNPYRIGVANLFTTEFYAAVAARLNQGGLFAQWVQGYEIDAATLATVMRTLQTAFGEVSIYNSQADDLILLASQEAHPISVDVLRRKLDAAPAQDWLLRARFVEGPEAIIAHRIASARQTRQLVRRLDGPVNTDDRNVLESAFAAQLGSQGYSAPGDIHRAVGPAALDDVRGKLDQDRFQVLRARLLPELYGGPEADPRSRAVTTGCDGNISKSDGLWPLGAPVEDAVEHWVRGYAGASKGDSEQVEVHARELQSRDFVLEASVMRARLAERTGDDAATLEELERGFAELRETPLHLCDASLRLLTRAEELAMTHPPYARRVFELISNGPFAGHALEGRRIVALLALAAEMKDPTLCRRIQPTISGRVPWTLAYLSQELDCALTLGSKETRRVREKLDEYIRSERSAFVDPFQAHRRDQQRAFARESAQQP